LPLHPRVRLRFAALLLWACCLAALPALPAPASAQTPAAAGRVMAPPAPGAPDSAAVQRGRAVYHAAGGCGCHTDYKGHGPELAGGRAIKTPFGIFYSTNLTPDDATGLGRWSEADFVRALREGIGPDGTRYFPVFPYTSFTRMSDADLRDLWAFLRAQAPVRRANRAHDVWPPFGWRISARAWQWLFFRPERFAPQPGAGAAVNRGAYLAQAVAHCGECHTPRNLAGVLQPALRYAGSAEGPEGEHAPNITPDPATGIGKWSRVDLLYFLETGLKPDGDEAQGLMGESIEHGYGKLPAADREALADYLRSLPPIRHLVAKRKAKP
jgi:mono/diheme cytochrome c family protein